MSTLTIKNVDNFLCGAWKHYPYDMYHIKWIIWNSWNNLFLDYILTWSTFGAHENQSLFKLVDPSQSKAEQKFISDKYFISIGIERRLQTQGADNSKSKEPRKSRLTPTFIMTMNLSDNSFQTRNCQVYPLSPCSYQTKTHPCQKTGKVICLNRIWNREVAPHFSIFEIGNPTSIYISEVHVIQCCHPRPWILNWSRIQIFSNW